MALSTKFKPDDILKIKSSYFTTNDLYKVIPKNEALKRESDIMRSTACVWVINLRDKCISWELENNFELISQHKQKPSWM